MRNRRLVHSQHLELRQQVGRRSIVEACADATDIDELVTLRAAKYSLPRPPRAAGEAS